MSGCVYDYGASTGEQVCCKEEERPRADALGIEANSESLTSKYSERYPVSTQSNTRVGEGKRETGVGREEKELERWGGEKGRERAGEEGRELKRRRGRRREGRELERKGGEEEKQHRPPAQHSSAPPAHHPQAPTSYCLSWDI